MTETRITSEHEAHYREHGFAIVEGFLTDAELAGALDDFEATVPGWVDYVANPSRPRPESWDKPYPGQRGIPHFPYAGDTLNALSLHAELRRFAAVNAGGQAIYCEQSHLTYKGQGSRGDREQHMHCDYVNHTLAYPPAGPEYWQTAYIYYFSDVEEGLAPTAICSHTHTPERILWPPAYSPEARPELYEHEQLVTVKAGSLLCYSMRVYHRGTAFQRPGGRLGMFVTYAPMAAKWLGIVGWAQEGVRREFTEWIERATVAERSSLGFPAPGDPYWTDETIAGVGARFANMDMSPYRA